MCSCSLKGKLAQMLSMLRAYQLKVQLLDNTVKTLQQQPQQPQQQAPGSAQPAVLQPVDGLAAAGSPSTSAHTSDGGCAAGFAVGAASGALGAAVAAAASSQGAVAQQASVMTTGNTAAAGGTASQASSAMPPFVSIPYGSHVSITIQHQTSSGEPAATAIVPLAGVRPATPRDGDTARRDQEGPLRSAAPSPQQPQYGSQEQVGAAKTRDTAVSPNPPQPASSGPRHWDSPSFENGKGRQGCNTRDAACSPSCAAQPEIGICHDAITPQRQAQPALPQPSCCEPAGKLGAQTTAEPGDMQLVELRQQHQLGPGAGCVKGPKEIRLNAQAMQAAEQEVVVQEVEPPTQEPALASPLLVAPGDGAMAELARGLLAWQVEQGLRPGQVSQVARNTRPGG